MAQTHRAPAATARTDRAGVISLLIRLVVGLLGLIMIAAGIWSFADPVSFAAWVQFPVHVHFLHDLGAFQVGIGVTLLLALVWGDGIAVALGGFLTGNSLHVTSHLMDAPLGGRTTDWLVLGLLSVLALFALVARLRQVAITSDADQIGARR